jgi:hypothetical protein
MLEGIIAAFLAAWLVKRLSSYLLGALVGGIILTNARTLINTWSIPDLWSSITYSFILILLLFLQCGITKSARNLALFITR